MIIQKNNAKIKLGVSASLYECRQSGLQILSKNLVTLATFKRWDGVKDDKS